MTALQKFLEGQTGVAEDVLLRTVSKVYYNYLMDRTSADSLDRLPDYLRDQVCCCIRINTEFTVEALGTWSSIHYFVFVCSCSQLANDCGVNLFVHVVFLVGSFLTFTFQVCERGSLSL